MKKSFLRWSLALFMCGLINISGCKKEAGSADSSSPPVPEIQKTLEPDWADLKLAAPVDVQLTYKSSDGNDENWPGGFRWYTSRQPEAEVDTPFINAVRKVAADTPLLIFSNNAIGKDAYAALAYKDDKAITLWFDINQNGIIDSGEQFEPNENLKYRSSSFNSFITPDFSITDKFGSKSQVKLLFCPEIIDDNLTVSCSPICMYEGHVTLDDVNFRMLVKFDPYNYGYIAYGASYFNFFEDKDLSEMKYLPIKRLSSLISLNNKYYRFSLDHTSQQEIKAVFAEDQNGTSTFSAKIISDNNILTDMSYAQLEGATDPTLSLLVLKNTGPIPVDDYRITYGAIYYGVDDAREYQTSIRNSAPFTLVADKECSLELGNVRADLSITKSGTNKAGSTFSINDQISIDAAFYGANGEKYNDFRKKQLNENNRPIFARIPAHLLIADSSGNTIVDQDMEYG